MMGWGLTVPAVFCRFPSGVRWLSSAYAALLVFVWDVCGLENLESFPIFIFTPIVNGFNYLLF